ncbi:MAG: hypothetical protein J0M23_05485 [Rickettsiales bacterium]|nr:hypothetical protein [Rickettsiales bacterium]
MTKIILLFPSRLLTLREVLTLSLLPYLPLPHSPVAVPSQKATVALVRYQGKKVPQNFIIRINHLFFP